MPADCSPGANLAAYKCLSCLSVSELLIIYLVVLADAETSGYSLPADQARLLEDAACWTCLSDKQLLQAAISANAQDILSEETPVSELRERIKCLLCATPKQIKAIIAMLVCKLGSPGGSCTENREAAPLMSLLCTGNRPQVIIDWAYCPPDTWNIYREIDGGGFAFLDSMSGALNTYTDATLTCPGGDPQSIAGYYVVGVWDAVEGTNSNQDTLSVEQVP